ncbi:arsenical pump-driving ATPase [Spirosoma utsteinense]|uniref:arsenite-transporting ATPase n=1 Tax=Spirosoma utsteinense TaxID=2585773 RepID=A0ABR6W6D0_9BACT|nr:arsenical pump-driving ATPase [Spirosoma utsteinense]MBC3789071.1 arsenite-transporting ATPase [Spirosoma utsteinense]MBC3792142.1 arsenite-transporting ATPase [Spirosoma utsteinense]
MNEDGLKVPPRQVRLQTKYIRTVMDNSYTKFLFFTGKGGVGKTSLACATAVSLADQGKKVLLISTDPASNLADVLDTEVSNHISPHKALHNLFTVNINPEVSAIDYRNRVLEPLKGSHSADELMKINEGLSGACTTEIASFDEFSRFITGEESPEQYDVVIFDTAPTGHTLRLLELPAAWDTFLDHNPGGASCIGPSSALKSSKERYRQVVNSLRDSLLTTFYLVSRADKASIREAAKTSGELIDLGMSHQRLLINGIFKAVDKTDPIARQMETLAENQLTTLPAALSHLPRSTFPLLPYNLLGLEKLRSLFDLNLQTTISTQIHTQTNEEHRAFPDLTALVDQLEKDRSSGLIMTMGKGGVGKTIIAATVATMLANRGHDVLLTTTDPAAHIQDFINQLPELPATLTVERIDPKRETQRYIDKVVAQKGVNLSLEGKALLLEDLQSPCTVEVAVFHAFSAAIHRAKRQFVVMDTAPTGHTLLLLDTTGSYHREVMKNTGHSPGRITTPYMSLQDSDFARILLVSLPETTPMREAEALQNDLKRAGITPFAWVINQCLSALPDLKDPLLRKRASAESAIINTIDQTLAPQTVAVPYLAESSLLPAMLHQAGRIFGGQPGLANVNEPTESGTKQFC